jgi:hypothetical protein
LCVVTVEHSLLLMTLVAMACERGMLTMWFNRNGWFSMLLNDDVAGDVPLG